MFVGKTSLVKINIGSAPKHLVLSIHDSVWFISYSSADDVTTDDLRNTRAGISLSRFGEANLSA